ncbi:flavin reductase family protein [Streptomyces sp. NPDC058398]|uniref:flavin reductase family protein n=1 Tax=Streptomyces sp. NPDC058398 TaxID=3346479 RepID=UPI0036571CAA
MTSSSARTSPVDADVLGSEQAAFRDAMAAVASPVAVVTAVDGERAHGTTVSAFVSLSLAPPMVLVSLAERSRLLAAVRRTGRFGLNVLGAHQADLAAVFARTGAERFEGVDWFRSGGLPRLPGSAAWVACEVADIVIAGDHVVVLAHAVVSEADGTRPLTYHQRSFGTHTPLSS